ncbi:PTS sugar transporter subunit IIC [Paenibacillus sp. DMB20]|uniref:PTS sugar transporter subunit IIC n=1 Tax=Paenibacillus sp. DMB20 TaxID=1642570 RepID=UPI00062805C4|nr:PTS sugar transporter subunit IIC [Paenibacillus sp. DMB20]KKO54188.1 transcriptional regulator [Paenibacillus sp. DMB20]
MDILVGTLLLLLVLSLFSLFSFKAPNGMKAMGALANAAVASFLVEAFQSYVGGDLFGFSLAKEVGLASGSMGGVAAAALVSLAMGVSPVYALLLGAACAGTGLLPGFIAGYLVSFLIKFIEKKVPEGLDLIVCIIVAAPLVRFAANLATPVVDATLLNIGGIITTAANNSPIIMGIVLGGVITVVATAPLSSMALTAMLGLTGLPMAIGALSVMGSSFMNFVFFKRMKFGDRRSTIAVAIEPLTQADVISANPIPVYITNFLGGAMAGVVVALFNLTNNATGTATPIAGLMVMYGFNDAKTVTIAAVLCALCGIAAGFVGSFVFKNFKIRTIAEIRGSEPAAESASAA